MNALYWVFVVGGCVGAAMATVSTVFPRSGRLLWLCGWVLLAGALDGLFGMAIAALLT